MSGTVCIIQARMNSTRLPGKLLMPLAGKPALTRMLERVRLIPGIDRIVVAVPDGPDEQPLLDLLAGEDDVLVTRGPEQDVLRRFVLAVRASGAERVVRITSDCPLVDPRASGAVIAAWMAAGTPCARSAFKSGYPHGFDTECVLAPLLELADVETDDPFEREHVMPFFWRRPDRFPAILVDHQPDRRGWRLTLDYPEDYELIRRVFDQLHPIDPAFGMGAIADLFARQPDLLQINADRA